MKLRILSKLRLLILILIALLAISGLFPGVLIQFWGGDSVQADTMLVLVMVYFLTFMLILLWLILVALERRLKAAKIKELDQ